MRSGIHRFYLISIMACLMACGSGIAQGVELAVSEKPTTSKVDTNYIAVFPKHVTGRLYLSRKFTDVEMVDDEYDVSLSYIPNTTLNLGVGATFRGFSLNLAYGFGFLNPDEGQGETRYLDLQSHVYKRKTVIDFYGQFYNGLYLENTASVLPKYEEPFYVRPDLRIRLFGFSYMHLFRGDRYSFSASFIQDEIQKKSAGSFLLGGEIALVYAEADSSMIAPLGNDSLFTALEGLNEIGFVDIGPKVGYTHTFILWKRFFITGTVFFRLAVGPSRYSYEGSRVEEKWLINPSGSGRFAMGYNSEKFYLGISVVSSTFTNTLDEGNESANFGVSNVRINFAKRFIIDKKWRDLLRKLPVIN